MSGPLAALAASDPAMAALVERFGPRSLDDRRRPHSEDGFAGLFRIVVGQQVSTAAARTIWERVCGLCEGELPGPEEAIELGEERLRGAGMSGRKASYVLGLAEAVLSGELDLDGLPSMADEEAISAISAIRGFGRWSAEMFLMLNLGRGDVFSGGDLGLRRGIQHAYGLGEPPEPEAAVAIAERWRPHRTLASIYLWEAASAPPPEGEGQRQAGGDGA